MYESPSFPAFTPGPVNVWLFAYRQQGPGPGGQDAELGLRSRAARLPDRVRCPQQDTVFTLRTTRYVELGTG